MKKILFLTGHIAGAHLKASALLIAEAFARRGNPVQIVTVDYSRLRVLKGESPDEKVSTPYDAGKNLKGYIWLPLLHPVHPRGKLFNFFTNWMTHFYPFLMSKRFIEMVKTSDVIMVESGFGMVLFDRMKQLNPTAKFICLMSDLMETLGFHPEVIRKVYRTIHLYDQVYYPAEAIGESLPKTVKNGIYLPQGIEKKLFKNFAHSPFAGPKNAISVGDMLFDPWVIETIADQNPEWTFHLFGKRSKLAQMRGNVIEHGEILFAELTPYLQHADIGIAPYSVAPNVEYLSQSSLKMVQYTYCRLPIVAPEFASKGRSNVCAYKPANIASLIEAFNKATVFDRDSIDGASVRDWDEVTDVIAKISFPNDSL